MGNILEAPILSGNLQDHAVIVEVEIVGVAIYRVEVQPGSGNFPSFSSKRTRQQPNVQLCTKILKICHGKQAQKLDTIKFTNKLRSYGLDHISRRVFDKWKHSTRLKRSATLQLDSEIRKELNLDHSSLEFLQEPLIPKNPPKNTCFELELLQPCSKKEDPVALRQKGLETIAILSQDNFAIAYTDGSSDISLSNGSAGIILLLPDGINCKHKINTGIIASNFTSELVAIREALILYQQDPHVIDSTEGLAIFSDSKSAIKAIRNGETNISCDIITLLEQLHNKRKSCIMQ
ncbi:ribonuclease H [Trichonephila clavipes]|nr:ribonuclease H [Trichonephila clavipes]